MATYLLDLEGTKVHVVFCHNSGPVEVEVERKKVNWASETKDQFWHNCILKTVVIESLKTAHPAQATGSS